MFATSTHMTEFIYVNKSPAGSNKIKFRVIWGMVIWMNIMMGIGLACSFIACLLKNNADYENRKRFDLDDIDDDFDDIGKLGAIQVNKDAMAKDQHLDA